MLFRGKGGTFGFFDVPALSGGVSAFFGANQTSTSHEVFGGPVGSSLERLFALGIPSPGGSTIAGYEDVAVANGIFSLVAAEANGSRAIYTGTPGSLTTVVNSSTAIPGGGGAVFNSFNIQDSATGNRVLFQGESSSSLDGFYSWNSGVLSRVIDSTTSIPGYTATFSNLNGAAYSYNGIVVYGAGNENGNTVGGIYNIPTESGEFEPIALIGSPDPIGDSFLAFGVPSTGGERTAFVGASRGSTGIYYSESGEPLRMLLSTGMLIPGTDQPITSVYPVVSMNERGNILFSVNDVMENAYILAWVDGEFVMIADVNTVIDGHTAMPGEPSLILGGYSGDQASFYFLWGPGENALYVATVPEPSTWVLAVVGAVLGFGFLRRPRAA
jgi:hypothetical protein